MLYKNRFKANWIILQNSYKILNKKKREIKLYYYLVLFFYLLYNFISSCKYSSCNKPTYMSEMGSTV